MMLMKIRANRSTMLKVSPVFFLAAAVGMIVVVVVVVVLSLQYATADSIVNFYENLIIRGSQDALAYRLDEDASRYIVEDQTVLDFGSFDFIVVGAGSAGAVIANRLSEVGYWNILLLEAGTLPNDLTDVPALYALGCFSDYNWGFKSIPQTTACLGTVDQKCTVPRGRGIGGTTLINGLVYSRGHPIDYDRWSNLVNDTSWSYDKVLPYFKKSEDFHPTDPEAPVDYRYHSSGGLWRVEHHTPSIPLTYTFLDANAELGYNFTDYNGPEKMGGTLGQYNTIKGKRHDQGTAFILPVLDRRNLWVNTQSYVAKIEINNDTNEATGVIFTHLGKMYRAAAKKEVILSAGVISSPQILMLSGIGPQQHLEELGIPVIKNLSVGATLRDHIGSFGLQFSSNITTPSSTLREQIEDFLNGTGALTSNTESHVIGWYKSSLEELPDYPDLEIVVDVSGESSFGQKFLGWNDETWGAIWRNKTSSFYLTVVLLHPQSIGSVKLNSSNPFDYPLIDYNLLSDPFNNDLEALYEGINLCLKLVNTTSFQKIEAKFEDRHLPACGNLEYLSREYWYCYIRQLSLAVFHPVGTCSMGTDTLEGAVVDSDLGVFGIRNLRVADASVFPFTLSSHPSADCAMIGEKVSDGVKRDHLTH